jgi:hypothetical protein
MGPRRLDPVGLAALAVVLAGLALLFEGLSTGVPLVFFGTGEEREAREAGRVLVGIAAGVLVVAGLLLLARGRPAQAALVAAAGIVPWSVMWLAPEAGSAWIAFLLLAPAALGAALAGLPRKLHRRTI